MNQLHRSRPERELTVEEIEAEEIAPLPDRELLSLVDGSLGALIEPSVADVVTEHEDDPERASDSPAEPAP